MDTNLQIEPPTVELENELETQNVVDETTEESTGEMEASETTESSEPYVGRWNQLISSTNWEKGRIISEWRANLQGSGAQVAAYSDETWARSVGGVTAPHVGRLRRVFEKFGEEHETYPSLYWTHFLAAMDWDDAPLWLEGAVRTGWSVSQMRDQRWEANGALPETKPEASDIVEADADEDVVMPAQGGGKEGRFDDEPGNVSAGPLAEGPDFGDEKEFDGSQPSARGADDDIDNLDGGDAAGAGSLVQPFAGLPELPGDMSDAMEMFKLSIIRHKATGWTEVAPESVVKTLDALKILVTARSE